MKRIKVWKKFDIGGDIGKGAGLDPNAGVGGNAAKGALAGASIGSVAGPWGCVCAGTKVITNSGEFKNIEDLKQEDGIIGWDGEKFIQQTIVAFQPPASKECIEIETMLGHILKCSIDHPIYSSGQGRATRYVVNGKRKRIRSYDYVDAETLSVGDTIGLINEIPIWGDVKLSNAYLVGLCIGDGTYGKDHGVRVYSADPDTWNYLEKNNLAAQIDKNSYLDYSKEFRSYRVINGASFFRKLGIYEQTGLHKRLPINLHSFTKESVCELLAGLIDTDGNISFNPVKPKNGKILFFQSNLDLIREVQNQFIKLGIHSSLRREKAAKKIITKKECNIKEGYKLIIKDKQSIINFYNNIPLNLTYKKNNLQNLYDYIKNLTVKTSSGNLKTDKIVRITKIGNQNIYNLEAGGANTYIANTIITHNTVIGGAVGGIGGGIYGAVEGNKLRKEMILKEKQDKANFFNQANQFTLNNAYNNGFNSQGVFGGDKYLKLGGLAKYPDGGYLQKIKTDNGVKYIYDKNQIRPEELPSINSLPIENNLNLITRPLTASMLNQKTTHNWDRFTPTSRKADTVSFGTRDNLPNNDPRNKRKFAQGGVTNLSSTTAEFRGATHANGGIKEPVVNGKKLKGVEVENNETISKSPDGKDFIFSERLGFAKQHKPLAKAMGKIEKKLQANPNDTLSKKTLQTLKQREEDLKIEQEQTKEMLGIPSDLTNLAHGGKVKHYNSNWYDRDGLAHFPLGGSLADPEYNINSYLNRKIPLDLSRPSIAYNSNGISPEDQAIFDKEPLQTLSGGLYQKPSIDSRAIGDYEDVSTPYKIGRGKNVNWSGLGTTASNVAGRLAPYAGIVSNLMLNDQANRIKVPTEALPDYVQYKPVDYTASRLEADSQRRSLNNDLTRNVTNSAVAAALKAKNLATTISAKNQINQQEANVNTEGRNRINLFNSDIQQRRNRIDVDNRDRQYDQKMKYILQKGNILTNASDIYQGQERDRRLYDLENRKIDLLKEQDLSREIYDKYLNESAKKQKKVYKLGGIMKSKKC